MRSVVRRVVVCLLAAHGLIHVLGAVKGFGWGEVSALTEPIGAGLGLLWSAAALLLLGAAGLLAARVRRWWLAGAVALVVSQAVILTSWTDARAGTAANLVLLAAVLHGYAAEGPRGLRTAYHRQAAASLVAGAPARTVVTEADLDRLPAPVADYLRRSGAVGRPRVSSFRAGIHGRIRGGPDQPWMTFDGEQVNTYGPEPTRTFFIDATRSGLGIDVLHRFAAGRASMRVRALSLLPLVDASGPDLARAETVTVFNDLCVLAPAALLDAPVEWQPVDDRRVRGRYSIAGRTVTAELVFDADHDLVDFVSDDRLRACADGRSFSRQRWSTPLSGHRDFSGRRTAGFGEARWHAPAPEGEFSYLEFSVDRVSVNVEPDDSLRLGSINPWSRDREKPAAAGRVS